MIIRLSVLRRDVVSRKMSNVPTNLNFQPTIRQTDIKTDKQINKLIIYTKHQQYEENTSKNQTNNQINKLLEQTSRLRTQFYKHLNKKFFFINKHTYSLNTLCLRFLFPCIRCCMFSKQQSIDWLPITWIARITRKIKYFAMLTSDSFLQIKLERFPFYIQMETNRGFL